MHIRGTHEQLNHVFAIIWVYIKLAQSDEENGINNGNISPIGDIANGTIRRKHIFQEDKDLLANAGDWLMS